MVPTTYALPCQVGTVNHSYPFCYRSDTPLIYRAVPSTFVNVEQLKDRLLVNNDQASPPPPPPPPPLAVAGPCCALMVPSTSVFGAATQLDNPPPSSPRMGIGRRLEPTQRVVG